MQYICVLLRRVRKIAKIDYRLRHVSPSVRSSAWIKSAPTGRVFMKFEILVFLLILSRKLNFHQNLTIAGTLHEDLLIHMISRSIHLVMSNVTDHS
jgi:hypothetical protein